MAGSNAGFDASAFNDAIHFVMEMAAPPVAGDQAVFHFAPVVTSAAPVAADGVPFDPDAAKTSVTPAPVKVPCVVEYVNYGDDQSRLGTTSPGRVRVTLLEDDYRQVADAAFIVVGGDRYDFGHTEAPVGLFSAGVWTMHFNATRQVA